MGRRVDFRNTILIMTSNIGTQDIKSFGQGIGFDQTEGEEMDYTSMKSTVQDALKNVFNPEFLNRIDDVIVFNPLNKDYIFDIIDIMSEDLFDRAEELGLSLEFDEPAKEFLTDKGFDQKYGARPLRRALQKYVEDPMAEDILHDEITEGDTVLITHDGDADELSFEVKEGEAPTEAPTADAEEGTPNSEPDVSAERVAGEASPDENGSGSASAAADDE
jgi:ATP-dependent Clp protease ATP-binding subunit ClpC